MPDLADNDVVIVEAVRSPLGRRNGGLATVHPADLLGTVQQEAIKRSGIDPMAVDLFDILSGGPPVSQINGSGTNWLVLGFQATDNTTGNTDTFYTEFGVPAAGS